MGANVPLSHPLIAPDHIRSTRALCTHAYGIVRRARLNRGFAGDFTQIE